MSSPRVVKNDNKLLIHTLEKGKIKLWRRENKGRPAKYRTFHTHALWYAGHRRPLSSRRCRELAYHNLRMAYMSLTKNTILVRSRLLYVYHRRPAHHRVALNAHRYYLHSRPARRFSRKIKGERERTKRGNTRYKPRAG